MQRIFILVFILFCHHFYAQTWTWMQGTDTVNLSTANGTVGLSTPNTRPCGVTNAGNWTDLSGNLWVFGGFNSVNYVNDLWKFDVSANQWTWISGTGTMSAASYGTLGITSTSNYPSSRQWPATWTDSSGDLWMFGGFGVATSTAQGYLGDLWKYNIASNQWTWISGSNTLNPIGAYGTKSVSTSTTCPGGRYSANTWQTGTELWLYGGQGTSSTTSSGYLGDMWKYDLTTNEWTWMMGASGTFPAANQGTQGFASSSNTPGSRASSAFWKDNSGNFWLSGGNGVWSGFGTCTWGDMWKYTVSTGLWVWVKGPTTPYLKAQYGTLGVGTSTTDPGARTNSASWVDTNGDLWLFGGFGYYQSALGSMNDLWKYTISTNKWTWMKGPYGVEMPGSHGAKYYPASTNNPEFRNSASAWTDTNGNFWLSGGSNFVSSPTPAYHYFSDVWRLSFCTTQPPAPTNLVVNTATTCGSGSISLSVNTSTAPVYWTSSATPTSPAVPGFSYTSGLNIAGTYTFYAQTVNQCTTSIPVTATLVVNPNPTLTVNSGTLCSGQNFTIQPTGVLSYTFTNGGTVVNPLTTTSYTLSGTGAGGCLSNIAVSTVTVLNLPIVSVNSGSVCSGAVFTLNPSGAISYTFPGNLSTVSPIADTSYTVTGVGANGCVNYAVANVSVAPLPTLTVNSGSICVGQVFTLIPGGAVSYLFPMGSATVSPLTNTLYTVVGFASNSCSNTAVSTVTVFSNPTLSINNGSICAGSVFTLNPSGAVSYTFPANASTVSPVSSTLYTIEGANAEGCRSSTSASLSVFPLPVISAPGGSICLGQSFTISPSGATTYTYLTGTAVVSPTINATYSIVGTSSVGCVSSAAAVVQVSVFANPVISVNSGNICSGNIFTLNPSGGTSYSVSGNSFTVSPLADASYTVVGMNANGCVSSAVSNVSVLANPSLVVNSGSICAGDIFTLNPTGVVSYSISGNSSTVSPQTTTSYTIHGTGANGCTSNAVSSITVFAKPQVTITGGTLCAGSAFTFNPSGALTYSISGNIFIVNPAVSGNYTVIGSDINGCTNTAVAALTVYANPTITVNNGTACAGSGFTLTPGGASSYTLPGNSTLVYPLVDTVYTITGENGFGCSASATSTVSVLPVPVLVLPGGTICEGSAFTLSPSGANSYTFPGNSNVVFPSVTTTYSVSGANVYGCTSTTTASVNVLPAPQLSLTGGSVCSGESFTLVASGAYSYTYSSPSVIVTPLSTATYTVMGNGSNGCMALVPASCTVIVNALPELTLSASDAFICEGEIHTVQAAGASTYTWNTGAVSPAIAVTFTAGINVFTVTGESAQGCRALDSLSLKADICTAIRSNQKPEALVFPNPFENTFKICALPGTYYKIRDGLGQVILQGQLDLQEVKIDLGHYDKGFFILECSNGKKRSIIKLVKH